MKRNVWIAALCCALMVVAGCGDDVVPTDDGGPTDGGRDSSMPGSDGGDSSTGPTCGDGEAEGAETCDDGNDDADDGCSATCAVEDGWSCDGEPSTCTEICGDGTVVGAETETMGCDDGNTAADDGCSATCAIEMGWACAGEPSVCTADCGDGAITGVETCDDGNNADDDGCSMACTEELGWDCGDAEPSVCTTTCGDGVKAATEGCDDGNTTAADGCDAACAVETGWGCTGTEPSVCMGVCGDSMLIGTETCDDGNMAMDDGCSMACTIEAGWACTGTPSVCTTTCGDSMVAGAEACDDGNVVTEPCAYGVMTCMVCAADCTSVAGATSFCGDGTTDTANAESCDDGNTTAGDGCSATCTLEEFCGDGVVNLAEACDDGNTSDADCCSSTCTVSCSETEPNDTAATASVMVAGTPATGGLSPAGDNDYWSFTLTAPSNVRIEAFHLMTGACASQDSYLTLYDTDGTTVLGGNDDSGLVLCPLIDHAANAYARALPAGTYYVRFNELGDNAAIARYELALTTTPAGCGDGYIVAPETCDDGNTAGSDGCSATCSIDSGYICGGAPSVCVMTAPNATCAGGTAISSTTTIVGENSVSGGPRPQGTDCGTSSGDSALYYTVTIPAMTRVAVATSTTASFDRVLLVQDACGDTSCTFRTDSSPEGTTLRNDTAAPITQSVAVHNYSSTGSGVYDIAFTYTSYVCGNGVIEGAETCDDSNTAASDGCSATCAIEAGWGCIGAPSVCSMLSANATCAGAIPMGASIMGTLSMGGGARPTGTDCGTSAGPVLYYTVDVPANSVVTLTADPTTSWDPTLRTLADCSGACIRHQDASSSGSNEVLRVYNTTGAPVSRLIAVGADSTSTFGEFTLTAAAAAPLAANATCSTGTAVSADISIAAEDISDGGPRPQGTDCGTSSGNSALYYTVTIPAATRVAVTTTSSLDRVLLVQNSCSDTSCAFRTDSSPEGTTLRNDTVAPITQIVAIHNWSSTGSGTFGIEFAYTPYACGNGVSEGTETCDDGNVASGDGCSATCAVEGDRVVSATGLPLEIPDDDTIGVVSTVTVAGACTIAAVRPIWSVSHGWASDVDMDLVAPDGTRVVLTSGQGGSSDLEGPYTFVTGATPAWPGTGSPIPAGIYGRDLSAFNGLAGAGTWTLEVRDTAAALTGDLTAWTLAIDCM